MPPRPAPVMHSILVASRKRASRSGPHLYEKERVPDIFSLSYRTLPRKGLEGWGLGAAPAERSVPASRRCCPPWYFCHSMAVRQSLFRGRRPRETCYLCVLARSSRLTTSYRGEGSSSGKGVKSPFPAADSSSPALTPAASCSALASSRIAPPISSAPQSRACSCSRNTRQMTGKGCAESRIYNTYCVKFAHSLTHDSAQEQTWQQPRVLRRERATAAGAL